MDFGYKKMYIGGQLCDAEAGEKKDVICPATGKSVGQIAWASKKDTQKALEAAQKGFEYWSKLSIAERNEWIARLRDQVIAHQELLQGAVVHEMGKTWDSALEDYESLVNALEWYPQEIKRTRGEVIPDVEGTHQHFLTHESRGVVAAILAWNFPLLNLSFKIGPALAAGCSIILKPSKESPISAYIVGELCHKIGFPAGVVNVICGSAQNTSIPLCESTIPRVLTMIGSSETGRKMIDQSTASIKKFGMELGGNAPALIFEDCDLDDAVNGMAALKYGNCGQVCVSPNRIFVQASIYDEFVKKFVAKAKAIKVGFGKDSGADMGPLIDVTARDRVMAVIDNAVKNGARILCGGKIPAGIPKGSSFLEPTVLENVNPCTDAFRKEMFGPVATLIKFESEEELRSMINVPDAGLSSYLYTKDITRIQFYTRFMEYGEVHVNGFKFAIYLPHRGIKDSGLGHDCSHLALEDYLQIKRVTIKI